MEESDLVDLLHKHKHGAGLGKKDGDHCSDGEGEEEGCGEKGSHGAEGENGSAALGESGHRQKKKHHHLHHSEIDEETLQEMCRFSNMATATSVLKADANGGVKRVGGGLQSGF